MTASVSEHHNFGQVYYTSTVSLDDDQSTQCPVLRLIGRVTQSENFGLSQWFINGLRTRLSYIACAI